MAESPNPFYDWQPHESGHYIGQSVIAEWDVDPAYAAEGQRTKRFTGLISRLEGNWIEISNGKAGIYTIIHRLRITVAPIVLPTYNPFLEL